MFEDWKQAWRQAVENFQREVAEGSPADAAPRVKAMEREVASANGALLRLDEEIRRTRREVEAEAEAERVCRRRERLARDVADDETVRVAADFAARHAQRAAVLNRKLEVLIDEHALLERDLDTMRAVIAKTPGVSVGDTTGTAAGGTSAASSRDTSPLDEREREDVAFSRLENDARDRAAAERLEELKRRMRH